MEAAGPAVTIAVAVPKMVPLVALTVLVNVPVTAPAVKRPVEALMVPPPAVTAYTPGVGVFTSDRVGAAGYEASNFTETFAKGKCHRCTIRNEISGF